MKYKKKALLVDAVEFNGTNQEEIKEFGGSRIVSLTCGELETLFVRTRKGMDLILKINYFVVKDSEGRIFLRTPESFLAAYEPEVEVEKVEAVQYTGTNLIELQAFTGWGMVSFSSRKDLVTLRTDTRIDPILVGDYIVKRKGELLGCPKDEFNSKFKLREV